MATQAQIDAAQDELDAYTTARTAILTRGQEVRINGRLMRRADLDEVNREIRRLTRKVNRLTSGGSRQVVPK